MLKADFRNKWETALEILETKMEQIKVDTYFRPLIPLKVSEKDLSLYFTCNTSKLYFTNIINKYQDSWKPVINQVFGAPYSIVITDSEADDDEDFNEDSCLNPSYTFDTFVSGPNNRLAFAAAWSVANGDTKNYNPLFLYGGSGLGKTHLMQAIGHYVKSKHPKKRVLYVSSEMFTNELISAIQSKKQNKFKEKYRKADYLLFDDVQFIAGKKSTEEELFNTFDALHNAGKQIVFTSDKPPKDLGEIPERLTTRFVWGMAVDIQPPDYETRMAILKNKAIISDLVITDELIEVLDVIAANVSGSIRDLEGALNRIIAHSTLTGEIITKEFAKNVLSEVFHTSKKPVTASLIKECVSKFYGVKLSDLEGSKRTRAIAYPRQVAIYLIRKHTDHSLPEIGEYFGGKDHTTVLYSCEKIAAEIKTGSQLQEAVKAIENMINQ